MHDTPAARPSAPPSDPTRETLFRDALHFARTFFSRHPHYAELVGHLHRVAPAPRSGDGDPRETDPYFVLDFCEGAIRDAIALEDGLDGETGARVLAMIAASKAARGRSGDGDPPPPDEAIAAVIAAALSYAEYGGVPEEEAVRIRGAVAALASQRAARARAEEERDQLRVVARRAVTCPCGTAMDACDELSGLVDMLDALDESSRASGQPEAVHE
jgi:hypothetical protein